MTDPVLPGRWDDLVVICATTPWDGHRLLDQPVARELARHTPVLYVDPPVSAAARVRTGATAPLPRGLQLVEPGLARLTPTAPPFHQRPGVKPLSLHLTRRALSRAVAALGRPTVRAVIVPSLNPLFGACGEQHRVFYAKDDYVAGARLMRISPARLRRADRRQPADADVVVTVSEVLAERYRAMGHDPLVIPNGVDVAAFAIVDEAPLPVDVHQAPGPVAGVIGTLGARLDVALLHAVADAGISLLLVGGRPAPAADGLDPLIARPEVTWVGPRPFAELPSYLRVMDVGLVPYDPADPFNRASSPLKVLEYLAAGRPVVSTDLPAVRDLHLAGEPGVVTVADGRQDFAAAVVRAAVAARDPELVARRRSVAARHGWSTRLTPLIDVLGLTRAEVGGR